MANHPERYQTFWTEFGRAVKEGLIEDPDNRETILDILSVTSTHDPDQPTTLRQYVERMKDGQKDIYYLTGESTAMIENSPHMEAFRAKGYEVLMLTDPVDEVWVEQVAPVRRQAAAVDRQGTGRPRHRRGQEDDRTGA